MKLKFLGAVKETTGSMHMLQIDDKNILLDCGLYQGKRKLSREKNLSFPFNAREIHSLVLSHAHIDHCGNIPNLVKQGFKGTIYSTSATQDLCSALLRDSAHIQQKDTEYLNKKLLKRNEEPIEPLYTIDDVERSLYYFNGIHYNREVHVLRDVVCSFLDAGHILGSAFCQLDIAHENSNYRLLFTGDIGRKNLPILRDPDVPKNVDFLIMESTYGNRVHGDIEQAENKLCDIVTRVYQRKGKIIIPAFSVGRTQEIVYSLHKLSTMKCLPKMPIFVDSPLSANATEIFRQHQECFDKETMELIRNNDDPFGFSELKYIRTVDKSKELNDYKEPCIIISASGMCEAGRILHHLKNNIEDPRNLILIVGFQAQNTLGRRIVEKETEIKIFGESYTRRAEVAIINAYSAHADRNELLEFALEVEKNSNLKKIFLVHGEEENIIALKDLLSQNIKNPEIIVAEKDMVYNLIA